ncbi:hypothetical protein MNBD_GAMMA09-2126 [hydrothermal vent metagenome]|uniref:Alpha/beta hydrolase n=1 Tax=hydrothermal vent metagenome TaxID=652676 RepID=A0A3B0Y0C3_9ZZZZ
MLLAVMLVCAGGCAYKKNIDGLVQDNKLMKSNHQSPSFSHFILSNQQYYSQNKSVLYVFIEGDGLPWRTRTQISANPDPVYPLALDLMSHNRYPSIYLSRPCYWLRDESCNYELWTNKRYSKQVVESMLYILDEVSEGFESITLVGYSGGGALAALMANSAGKITRLITLAGNLDHLKWTRQHGYTPLKDSLNPFEYTLPSTVEQYHFAAENDKNILPAWIKTFSDKQINSRYILLKNADHSCCWLESWEDILKTANR